MCRYHNRYCPTVCLPLTPGSPLSPLDEDIIRAGNIGQGYENSHLINLCCIICSIPACFVRTVFVRTVFVMFLRTVFVRTVFVMFLRTVCDVCEDSL